MIEIKSVTKKYGDFTAIEDISLTVEESSVLGLAGFNGSGKTTLLNVCAGIFKPDNGAVYLDGTDVFNNDTIRDKLFYVSDDLWFPVGATIKSAGKFYSTYYPQFDFEVLNSLCELFGLDKKKQVRGFSKGMTRQAGLAIAFAAKPKYLLIDETFDGLDPHKKELLRKLILEYINETGACVIVSSHDLAEISGVCDHVAIIKGKQLVFYSPIEDISNNLRKVLLVFPDTIEEKLFEGITCKNLKINGKQASLTLCGDIDKELEKINSLGAESVDIQLLTLEEVFTEETEAQSDNEKIKRIFK